MDSQLYRKTPTCVICKSENAAHSSAVKSQWDLIETKDGKPHIHRLPVELLSYIFDLCTSREQFHDINDFHQEYLYNITSCSGPLNLTRVCKHWEAVTVSTSSLWTHICPSFVSVAGIRQYLAVSPRVPLYLRILDPEDCDVPADHAAQEVFELFIPHAGRWRSLFIELDKATAKALLDMLRSAEDNPESLPLEDLSVVIGRGAKVAQQVERALLSLVSSLESLRRLMWIHPDGNVPPTDIPWGQLKTVIIEIPLSFEEVYFYLSQCICATTVKFKGGLRSSPRRKTHLISDSFPHVSLANLTSLTLSKGCDPIRLLQNFTLPSLRSLDIDLLHRNHAELDRFVERSPCLQSLVVNEYRSQYLPLSHDESKVSDQDIIDYLTSPRLHSIPRVGIFFEHSKERVLEILHNHKNARTLVPRLMYWVKQREMCRLVGWCDEVDDDSEWLLFSYQNGSLEFTEHYEHDYHFD